MFVFIAIIIALHSLITGEDSTILRVRTAIVTFLHICNTVKIYLTYFTSAANAIKEGL